MVLEEEDSDKLHLQLLAGLADSALLLRRLPQTISNASLIPPGIRILFRLLAGHLMDVS